MVFSTLCIYCGIRPGNESEHVIGNVFYVDPPKNGITVPSCSLCNRGRGDGGLRDLHLDEEYMRNILCLASLDRVEHPVAETLATSNVTRSLHRRRGSLRRKLLRSIAYTERRGSGGILEPYTSPFIRPNFSRFQRVLRKITKGLYYRVANTRLTDDYVVLVNPVIRPERLPNMVNQLRSDELSELQAADEYEVFKFMLLMKGESRTEWLMLFYNWAAFHTWTLPKREVTPGDTGMPPMSRLRFEIF